MALSLRDRDARVDLAPDVGGAIVAFAHGDRDVLRPTSDDARAAGNVRAFACFPLVPYSNRIANAELAFGESTHALAHNFGDHPHSIHGLCWQKPWRVVEEAATSAQIAFEHRPAGNDARAWPWPFDAWQSFALAAGRDGALLTLVLGIRNVGEAPFPFGLGWHPFFPRDASTKIGFHADAVWQTDATQLPTARVPVHADWSFDPPRAPGDTPLDNVYAGWRGEATLTDARGAITAIRADRACRFLIVFAPRDRPFVALEPVTHMTDAFNRAQRGEAQTGTRVLAPGAAFSCTMQIASRPAP